MATRKQKLRAAASGASLDKPVEVAKKVEKHKKTSRGK
jgi:hypothetical protein